MAINGLGSLELKAISPMSLKSLDDGNSDVSFVDYLKNALNETNNMLLESDRVSEEFAAGNTDNIHQVLIASEKANIALQFTMQVRNKIMDAYTEIMRMQI